MRKRIIFIFFLLLLGGKNCSAFGSELVYRGYVKNEAFFNSINTGSLLNPQNAILNLKDTLDTSVLLVDATWNISDSFRFKFKPQMEYRHVKPDTQDLSAILIKESYFAYTAGNWSLNAGKEVLGWGQGMVWNPSNLIDPRKNFSSPFEEREGSTLFKGIYQFSDASLSLVFVPVSNVTSGSFTFLTNANAEPLYSVKWAGQQEQSDYSLNVTGSKAIKTSLGLEASITLDSGWVLYSEGSIHQGSSNYYVVRTSPTTFQFSQTKSGDTSLFGDLVFGGRYNLTSDLTVSCEYYHHGDGYGGAEAGTYFDSLEMAGSNYLINPLYQIFLADANSRTTFANLRQNYLDISLNRTESGDKLRYQGSVLLGLDDGSGSINASAEYFFTDPFSLRTMVNLPFGPLRSEFGSSYFTNQYVITATYYF